MTSRVKVPMFSNKTVTGDIEVEHTQYILFMFDGNGHEIKKMVNKSRYHSNSIQYMYNVHIKYDLAYLQKWGYPVSLF